MDVQDLKRITFGKTSAEAEKEEYPELLIDGFIDDSGIIKRLVEKSTFLVYGQKGSGKSAIGSRILLMYSDSDKVSIKTATLDNFDYSKFDGFDSNKGIKEASRNRSWETVLYIALLEMMNNSNELEFKNGFARKVIDDLYKYEIIPSGNLDTIIKKASKKTLINLKMYQDEKETSDREISYDNLHDNLHNAVMDCIPKKKQLYLLDGLDSIMSNSEKQYQILSSLLHAVYQINSKMRANEVNAKIILFCRTDLLDRLTDPNKQKIIDDYGYGIFWYKGSDDVSNNNLIRLINLRADVCLKTKGTDVFSIFPQTVKRKEVRKYILDHTRYLPRDIIRLMNEIKDNCNGKCNVDLLETSVKNYSSDYFFSEIKDEFNGFMKQEEVEQLFTVLKRLPNYLTDECELKSIAEKLGYNLDFNRILKLMFEAGAIGNVRVNPQGGKIYAFKYRERRAEYNPSDKIIIHLALQNALKVKTGTPISLILTE